MASAGSQVKPGPRLRRYARTTANPGSKTACRNRSPHPPCRVCAAYCWRGASLAGPQNGLFGVLMSVGPLALVSSAIGLGLSLWGRVAVSARRVR